MSWFKKALGGIGLDLFDSPKVPKPEEALKLAPEQAKQLISYYEGAVPGFLALSEKFGPQFMEQMLGQTGAFLGGTGGQPGFMDLLRITGAETGKTISDLRAGELGAMAKQTPLTRGLMEALSPEQAAAIKEASGIAQKSQKLESEFTKRSKGIMGRYGSEVGGYKPTLRDVSGYAGTTISDEQAQSLLGGTLGGISPYVGETISGANADVARATQMAQEAFERRGALSPEEQRAAQQQARESGQAAGRLGGNAAIAAEIQNREAAKAARRGEAAQLGQQAFAQQLGAAGQRLAAEQALYGQRGANVERDIALQQARFGQGLGALQQRLATQQARYGQLGAEQERELSRRQNLFSQGIAGGAQRAAERQLGFSQLMDIEAQKARLRGEAAGAGQNLYNMAGQFYTTPGLNLLSQSPLSYGEGKSNLGVAMTAGPASSGTFDYNMPLGFAKERAGALDAYNMAKYQADQQRRAGIMNLLGTATSLGSAVMTGGASMGLGGLMTNMGGGIGSTGLFNAGANLFNIGAGAGTPLKATIV